MSANYLYHEEGGTARVEIAEDLSNDEWESYSLRVIEQLRPSRFGDFGAPGETFTVQATKDQRWRHYVHWRLESEDPAPRSSA